MALPNGTQAAVTPQSELVAVPAGPGLFHVDDDDNAGISVPESVFKGKGPSPVATVATPPATPTPSDATPDLPTHKHPEHLVRQVDELGLPPYLLEALDTNDLSRVVVDTLRQERLALMAQDDAVRRLAPGKRDAANNPPQPEAVPAQEAFDWGEYEESDEFGRVSKRKYTDDDISPVFREHVKKLYGEISSLKKVVGELQSAAKESVQRQAASKADAELNAVFDSMPETFGTGDPRKLDRKLFLRRATVAKAAAAHINSLPEAARGSVSIKDAALMMAEAICNARPKAAEVEEEEEPLPQPRRQQARPTPEQYRNGSLAKPTQRNTSPEPPGPKKAAKALAERLKALEGVGDEDDDGEGDTTLEEFLR